jgi:lipopolysaccharide/colanic/teichoic acid biosynthesis glycosyltransferase
MMVRVGALTDVGLMDERFFLYFEDVDWCFRMWRGGWKVFYVADSVMHHGLARESARPGFSRLLVTHVMSLFHFYDKWGRLAYAVKRFRRAISTVVLLVSDIIAINGSFALAYVLRSSLGGLLEKPMFGVRIYQPFLAFANLVFVFSFAFFGLYRGPRQRQHGTDLLFTVLRASLVSSVILMASTFLTYQTYYSRFLVGLFCLLVVLLVTCFRVWLRRLHRLVRAGRFDLVRIVVVGTGATAERLAERIAAHAGAGYDLAGLVAVDGDQRGAESPRFPVVGTLAELPELIERHRIGEVVFGEPRLSADEIADFLLKARRSGVDVRMVSGLTGILTQRARVEEFLEMPVVSFEREALLGGGAAVKRVLDVLGAAVLLVLWSPMLALVALSGGDAQGRAVFSGAQRAGIGGVPYRMLVLGSRPRPNALHRFVCRHGLSAFPALINVMRGQMSLVGPAPVSLDDMTRYDTRERLRFDARPGITGLSQVASTGGAFSHKDAAALDLYYIQNWSLGGDARILLRWLGRCLAGRCEARDT